VRESTRIGPSGAQERLFYPHGVRLRDLGGTFGWAIWMLAITAFLWYSIGALFTPTIRANNVSFVSFINPFVIIPGLVWVASFCLFVMALNELFLARPFFFFVSQTHSVFKMVAVGISGIANCCGVSSGTGS
jgi:hypothetical protein